jgi:hypothetical protein
MAALRFLLISALASALVCLDCYVISDLTDYDDYDKRCIAVWSHQAGEWPSRDRMDKCRSYNEKLELTFYDSVEDFISTKPHRQCVMELVRRYELGKVFIKAIAYGQFKEPLVGFATNATCEGVVSVLRVDNEGNSRAMHANLIGSNKSLWKLRACLNDLFGAFDVREIVFVNQGERIGARSFGAHLKSFLGEVYEAASAFCSDTVLDEKFALLTSQARKVWSQTHIECFYLTLVKQKLIEPSVYRLHDKLNLTLAPVTITTCEEMMRDEVEKAIVVDLFGFTEPSQRVKDCVVEKSSREKFVVPVLIMPAIEGIINLNEKSQNVRDLFKINTRRVIETTFECLEKF